jgi:hypothetical protein
MIKRLAALLVFLHFSVAYSQTIKTDVLVIGGTPSGVAAAIQTARSKVKTVLIEQGQQLCPDMADATTITINADRNLSAGIWGEFRKRVTEHYKKTPGYDTAYNAPLKFEQETGAAILSAIADTVKNLEIKLSASFIAIKKDDDRWEVTITQNGKTETIKPRVVIDATKEGLVAAKAGGTYTSFASGGNKSSPNYYRTSIAMGDMSPPPSDNIDAPNYNYPPYPNYCVPLKAIVAKGVSNILITQKIFKLNGDIEYLPAELTLGQGAGATAAYCAFFKTTTANLKPRLIQGELLDFKGYLLPLADISTDPYWRAIQQICSTGLLRGKQEMINNKQQFVFMPDSIVMTAEVKPVLLEIYTRAFLWFNAAKPGKEFTVGNLLSFISEITLTDPDNMQKSMAKDWKAKFKFNSDFDLERPITRREFAILANKYLNPFGRAVDLDGRVVN